jgi:hypothetical protein
MRQLEWRYRYEGKGNGHAYLVELAAVEEALRMRFRLQPWQPVVATQKGAGSITEREAYRRYRALERAAKKVSFGQLSGGSP